jgi:hypothetical protein
MYCENTFALKFVNREIICILPGKMWFYLAQKSMDVKRPKAKPARHPFRIESGLNRTSLSETTQNGQTTQFE